MIPDDLAAALGANPAAERNFEAFSSSVKKGILFWIATAKRDATRERRIAATTSITPGTRSPYSGSTAI